MQIQLQLLKSLYSWQQEDVRCLRNGGGTAFNVIYILSTLALLTVFFSIAATYSIMIRSVLTSGLQGLNSKAYKSSMSTFALSL